MAFVCGVYCSTKQRIFHDFETPTTSAAGYKGIRDCSLANVLLHVRAKVARKNVSNVQGYT